MKRLLIYTSIALTTIVSTVAISNASSPSTPMTNNLALQQPFNANKLQQDLYTPPPNIQSPAPSPVPSHSEVQVEHGVEPQESPIEQVARDYLKQITPPPFHLDDSDSVPQEQEESAALEALHISPVPQEPVSLAPKIEYLDLTLIRSPDLDSIRFVVKDHSIIGRDEGHLIFKDDPYISPVHATLYYKENELFIRDEGSFNGVYIRLYDPIELTEGETFIAGEQLFCLESEPQPMAIPNAQKDVETKFFANSSKGVLGYYLIQKLDGGQNGAVYPFVESSITVGRQGCDVNAPMDRFMSSRHCHVSLMNGKVILTDTGSKNGTFVKIKGEQKLNVGDYVLIGKQLLQVQPHQPGSRSKVAI